MEIRSPRLLGLVLNIPSGSSGSQAEAAGALAVEHGPDPAGGRSPRVLMVVESCGVARCATSSTCPRGSSSGATRSPDRSAPSYRSVLPEAIKPSAIAQARLLRPLQEHAFQRPFCGPVYPSLYAGIGPFDVIHGHSSKGGALSRLGALGSDVRVFYTPDALVTMDPRLSPLKRLFYQAVEWGLSKATDRIIAVSPEEQRHGIRFGLSRSRVILISNGVEPVPFPPLGVVRRELCLPEDCRAVGSIGR